MLKVPRIRAVRSSYLCSIGTIAGDRGGSAYWQFYLGKGITWVGMNMGGYE